MSTAVPPALRNPDGVFIHALTAVTNAAESAPETAIGIEQSQCARGESRSQPYR